MKESSNQEEIVPERPLEIDLKAMALRQQQQIDCQQQLLATKEQRLRFLKGQDIHGGASIIEGERLRRLRERVEAQESKLRRLRALRGQVDLQKAYNLSLTHDLDSIRALFSEKEKELSLAVAKVDALTRQLEELRRDRRGPLNLIHGGVINSKEQISPATKELGKLRRELAYRNQLSLQQDARLHLQREALHQRQAELLSVDQRILELQIRIQRKKDSNLIMQTKSFNNILFSNQSTQDSFSNSITEQEQSNNTIGIIGTRNISQRTIPKENIAAVEPYVHTPQESKAITQTSASMLSKQIGSCDASKNTNNIFFTSTDSDEYKLALQKIEGNELEFKKSTDSFSKKINNSIVNTAGSGNSSYGTAKCDVSENNKNSFGFVSITADKDLTQQLTVHSSPLNIVNRSVAIAIPNSTGIQQINDYEENNGNNMDDTQVMKAKFHSIPSGNLVVPPRKPVNTVVPNLSSEGLLKICSHKPKVNMVAPNVYALNNLSRPVLPPKPLKSAEPSSVENTGSTPTVVSLVTKASSSEPTEGSANATTCVSSNVDNLPIKARPLTIKKQPLSEQPRLKNSTTGIKQLQHHSRKIDRPLTLQFTEATETDSRTIVHDADICKNADNTDMVDKSIGEIKVVDEVKRRARQMANTSGKIKLIRRVSFDPLALLLDASLEGEVELVKKTAMQVPNPSAANDEGITALHNAICAGHFEIVKFLVQFGCDVNAQDSDGWTPLHCAASCNNLTMVKFLVESGACLFAVTLSDHETPAEKCEEDEEGFDGCSEYLYSIQEKLGILHSGEVYAVFSYDAQQSDELSFEVNCRLIVLRKGDDAEREWWWAKDLQGKEGYVPRNLLGLYPRLSSHNSLPD